MQALAAIAAASLAAALHSFSLNGGPVLCVPESELDVEGVSYARNASDLASGGVTFAFSAADMRRQIPDYAVDPELEAYRPASAFHGSVELPREPVRLEGVEACNREVLQVGRYAGHELRSCTRTAVIDGFLVTYRFQEPNAPLIAAFDQFLHAKIAEWRANCHATRRL